MNFVLILESLHFNERGCGLWPPDFQFIMKFWCSFESHIFCSGGVSYVLKFWWSSDSMEIFYFSVSLLTFISDQHYLESFLNII